jgi:peptide chain release factor 1
MEIRAGAGGDEASLFAGDLYRMYAKYCEAKSWRVEILNTSDGSTGGYKEIIAKIDGDGAYSRFKFESGVHRVQRVPATESSGRIHTSTITVSVLPEAEELDFKIEDADIQVDYYRSSGPGGQSVNTTDSAVRLTYKPTGMIVTCQNEKSQIKNKISAMKVLVSRLLKIKEDEEAEKQGNMRLSQIGTGDRSEKIRTYNYLQDRITDHRIGQNWNNIPTILEGEIDPIIDKLAVEEQSRLLTEASEV